MVPRGPCAVVLTTEELDNSRSGVTLRRWVSPLCLRYRDPVTVNFRGLWSSRATWETCSYGIGRGP